MFDTGLCIQMDSLDIYGRPLSCCYALWTETNQDRAYFWAVVREMRRKRDAGEELWMHLDPDKFPLPDRRAKKSES